MQVTPLQLNQARHIPIAPGKEHVVEVGGTHISTASSADMWNLDGFICCFVIVMYH